MHRRRFRWISGLFTTVIALLAGDYLQRYERLYNGLPRTSAALGPGPIIYEEIRQYHIDFVFWLSVFVVTLAAFLVTFLRRN